MDEATALRRERDLLERLLDIGQEEQPESFLQEVLAVAVERTGALRGYLALLHEDGSGRPRWWRAIDCDEQQIAHMEQATSSGVVAAALSEGRTLRIVNAMLDPTWSAHASIQRNKIEAVICCPVGEAPPAGVLLLQGRPGGGPFRDEDVRHAEKLARWITPMARRHLVAHAADPTAELRARLDVADLVGTGAAMTALLQQVELAARFDIDVLLLGPTGGGKTAVARAIARNSDRRAQPFIKVNCGGIQDTLFDSELFGAAPGSYTGVRAGGTPGLVGAAEGGVLFLDEVGELTPSAQAALLEFLDEDKRYRRVGETAQRTADVRVLAATNRDLLREVEAGRFRRDLYHRLTTLVIRIPSLDERREDILPIAEQLLRDAARQQKLAPRPLTPGAMHALRQAEWPGNVRELSKVLLTALIRANHTGVTEIGLAQLFPERAAEPEVTETWREATRRFQRQLLQETLDATGWSYPETCQRLDISRSQLYELLRAFGLSRPE